jgi:hypothetical protein
MSASCSSISTRHERLGSYTGDDYWRRDVHSPVNLPAAEPHAPPAVVVVGDSWNWRKVLSYLLIVLLVPVVVLLVAILIGFIGQGAGDLLKPLPVRPACACPSVTNSYVVPINYGSGVKIYAPRQRVDKQHTAECDAAFKEGK